MATPVFTVRDVQQRLADLGYDPQGVDGLIGPDTLTAVMAALAKVSPIVAAPSKPNPATGTILTAIPADWLPWAHMLRIIFHWTAGQNEASKDDRKHYHLLVESVNGAARLVRGTPSILLNDAPVKPGYAAHTLNANGDAIGTSLCGMTGAEKSPFMPGPDPITLPQGNLLVDAHAQMCGRYSIPVTRKTLLSHAEVQETLGIKQRGKWDVARLPFDLSIKGARAIGDRMRDEVLAKLH